MRMASQTAVVLTAPTLAAARTALLSRPRSGLTSRAQRSATQIKSQKSSLKVELKNVQQVNNR